MTTTTGTCPVKVNGPHYVEWMEVPATIHDGDLETVVTPAHMRGICLDCGEQFIRE